MKRDLFKTGVRKTETKMSWNKWKMQSQWEIPGHAVCLKLCYFCTTWKESEASLKKKNVPQHLEKLSLGSPGYANSKWFKTAENVNFVGKMQADVYLQWRQSCPFDVWKRLACKNRLHYCWDKLWQPCPHSHPWIYKAWATRLELNKNTQIWVVSMYLLAKLLGCLVLPT